MAKPLLAEEARERADHGAAEPGGGAAERAGMGEACGDPALVLGLGGDALRRRRLAHEQEADVAEHHDTPEHEEGRLPVVLDARVLEGLGGFQGDDPAELEAGPPADHRRRRARRHGLALRPADLLDPERVDGDVLGRGGDGDDEPDGDDGGEACRRLRHAPEHEADQDRRLKGDDPGPPLPDPPGEPGQPDPVDERRPQEVEGIDAEDEAGPADRAAAESVLLQPEAEAAADEDPGEAADDPEQEDAGHPPLEVDGKRVRESLHEASRVVRYRSASCRRLPRPWTLPDR